MRRMNTGRVLRLWTVAGAWLALAGCEPLAGAESSDAEASGDVALSPADEGASLDVGLTIDAAVDAAGRALEAAVDSRAPDGPPPRAEDAPRFAFPIDPADRHLMFASPVFGVDHDPTDGRRVVCTNYDGLGFPNCYDGHEGTDILLRGDFDTLDRGSAHVVAAAGGEVIRVEDGHYDRCHGDLRTAQVSCDGHEMAANKVYVRHANGWVSHYLHLKQGSTAVAVGDRVRCGDVLGLVGSSGNSSAPHLHFEVHDGDGLTVDPFAGSVSGPRSLWVLQSDTDRLPGPTCDPSWSAAP